MAREKSACLSRMPEEVRLLLQADTITDYPTQLLRAVEEELGDVGAETPREAIEAHENRRQLLELDVLHALRVLKAFQQTRHSLLDRMSVRALGQFEAFDEQTLLKLSDSEKEYLKEACAAEHARRDEFNTRNVGDKNGKPSAFADVVFERECLLEEPWHFRSCGNAEEGDVLEPPPLCFFERGTVSRLPLYRAMQLRAKGIVRVLQVQDHQWVQQDSAAFVGFP
ncbi:hypothetical protein Emag_003732 [Eimeria magna]